MCRVDVTPVVEANAENDRWLGHWCQESADLPNLHERVCHGIKQAETEGVPRWSDQGLSPNTLRSNCF